MAGGIFELFRDSSGGFGFRLKAPTGEILAVGEGFSTKAGAETAIESIRMTAPLAFVVDRT